MGGGGVERRNSARLTRLWSSSGRWLVGILREQAGDNQRVHCLSGTISRCSKIRQVIYGTMGIVVGGIREQAGQGKKRADYLSDEIKVF